MHVVRHEVQGGAKIYKYHCVNKELLQFYLKERLLVTEIKLQEFLIKTNVVNF